MCMLGSVADKKDFQISDMFLFIYSAMTGDCYDGHFICFSFFYSSTFYIFSHKTTLHVIEFHWAFVWQDILLKNLTIFYEK